MGNTSAVTDNIAASVAQQNELTEAVKATEKAQKGSLAAFDQLNTISSSDSSDSGSDSSITAASAVPVNVETSDAENKINDFLERTKGLFSSYGKWFNTNFAPIFKGIWNGLKGESQELWGTLKRIFSDIQSLGGPLLDYYSGDFLTYLQTAFSVAGMIAVGLFDTFNMVFRDIWDLLVFPVLSDFITIGLPLITQFKTEAVETLGVWFTEVKSIFDMLWADAAQPVLTFIAELWGDLMESLKTFWDKWGKPIFEKFREAITKTGELFNKVWTNILKPIFEKYMAKLDELWTKHMKPLVDNLLDFVGEFINAALDIYNGFIAPVVGWFAETFGPTIVKFAGIAIDAVGSVVGNLFDAASHIIDYLKGVVNFVAGVFTGDWNRAWDGIKQGFAGIWSAFVDIVKTPLNLIIGLLSTAYLQVSSTV